MVTNLSRVPDAHIFAFQEIPKEKKKSPNDTAIFNSMTSLMKAQAYEIESLPERKTTPSVYQFNLLSVVEADMRQIFFDGEKREIEHRKQAHHVASYIIRKKQTFSRVHFVHISVFQEILQEYDRLHEANSSIFTEEQSAFYPEALTDFKRKKVFLNEFKWDISRQLWRISHKFQMKTEDFEKLYIWWNSKAEKVEIILEATEDQVTFLNNSAEFRQVVAKSLKQYYRYDGDFTFVKVNIPF
jgi:hypothetical protein